MCSPFVPFWSRSRHWLTPHHSQIKRWLFNVPQSPHKNIFATEQPSPPSFLGSEQKYFYSNLVKHFLITSKNSWMFLSQVTEEKRKKYQPIWNDFKWTLYSTGTFYCTKMCEMSKSTTFSYYKKLLKIQFVCWSVWLHSMCTGTFHLLYVLNIWYIFFISSK